MSAGDKWRLPNGTEALELDGSTAKTLRICVIKPNWPFPQAPVWVRRASCERVPMRYYGNKLPQGEDAPF